MRKQYSQPSMSVQTFVIVGQTLCTSTMTIGGDGGSQGTARMPGRIIED